MNKSKRNLCLIVLFTIISNYFIIADIIDSNNQVKNKNDLLTKGDCIIINTEIKLNNNCYYNNRYNGRVHVIAPNDLTDSDKVVRCDQYTNVNLILQDNYPIGSEYTCYYNDDTLRFYKYSYNNIVILPLFIMDMILVCWFGCIYTILDREKYTNIPNQEKPIKNQEKPIQNQEKPIKNQETPIQISNINSKDQELYDVSID